MNCPDEDDIVWYLVYTERIMTYPCRKLNKSGLDKRSKLVLPGIQFYQNGNKAFVGLEVANSY